MLFPISWLKSVCTFLLISLLVACGGGSSGGSKAPSGADVTPPVISLNGESQIVLLVGQQYEELGATAQDAVDGKVAVVISGAVDTSSSGEYKVTYTATDASGNASSMTRVVIVNLPPDVTPPVVTLNGASQINLLVGQKYEELGATAQDTVDGKIEVVISGSVDTSSAGEYKITYTATDAAANSSSVTRLVIVSLPDLTPPTITLNGDAEVSLFIGQEYVELGATAVDDVDGRVDVQVAGHVLTTSGGKFILTYTARDAANNVSTLNRTVTVVDNVAPVINLNGAASISHAVGTPYVEAGANATDETDGSVAVTITGEVNSAVLGSYTVTYSATDKSGNTRSVNREVRVFDGTAPVITLKGEASVTLLHAKPYVELGASATDAQDGDIGVNISGSVNSMVLGEYKITYSASDKAGNESTATRQVLVVDKSAPVVTLIGAESMSLFIGDSYVEQGAEAVDNVDGQVTPVVSGSVDVNQVGEYTLTYTATDGSGNKGSVVRQVEVKERKPFITTWNTANQGVSANNQISLTLSGGRYTVDWGDGSVDQNLIGNSHHSYATPGVYTVKISSNESISFYMSSTASGEFTTDNYKLLTVEQWGDIKWKSMSYMFREAINLTIPAKDSPDLSNVTSTSNMFYKAESFNSDIGDWDMSNVTSIGSMFNGAKKFNQDLSAWDVSNVSYMVGAFWNADSFNGDVSTWNVSKVTDMSVVFSDAFAFNQDISNWDVSNVTRMSSMFNGASSFNQPIGNWNVANVTNMEYMFMEASNFDQNINNWDVSKVTITRMMFYKASSFNQPIGSWNVSKVGNMESMFSQASVFNQDIGSWNVSIVTNMRSMFREASAFNQDIGNWNVFYVINMNGMFSGAVQFDQNLGNWNVTHMTDMDDFLDGVTLSTKNYDALLLGWSQLQLKSGVRLDAGSSRYSSAASAAKQSLVNSFNWLIIDGGIE